ncbi:MAG: J domain-containing protein [Terracidiphilus sp.]
MAAPAVDYYEFLQISPHAEAETIHRVYRFLAARLHPDNMKSGSAESFQLLKVAYDVLSNPKLRAEYDATLRTSASQPLSSSIDFMDNEEGEANRRLAVLAVLYSRRRRCPNFPEISLAEIETQMGFPRDYLDFTLWYLEKKGYISRADNAQFVLTVDGVDFVEMQRGRQPTLNKLLTGGTRASIADGAGANEGWAGLHPADSAAGVKQPGSSSAEQRGRRSDRRNGASDSRAIKAERRFHAADRRENPAGERPSA